LRDDLSQSDLVEWIRKALAEELPPETPEHRLERMTMPETDTARFVREALGEAAPKVEPIYQKRALVILLEAEQDRRRILKQEAN